MAATTNPRTGRITGFDVARAIAIVGMMVAHYVEAGTGSGLAASTRDFVDGRAMPLFMVLGGIGISYLVARSDRPDRDLLTRALILFPMGIALQEATTDIAIILQYYAVFFVVATALRHLPTVGLLPVAAMVMVAGALTKQLVAPELPSYGGWDGFGVLVDPGLWWSTVLTGYYPVFPAMAFILVGMWLGRHDPAGRSFAEKLVVVGLVLAFAGSWGGAWIGDQVGADGVYVEAAGPRLDAGLLERYAEEEALTPAEAEAELAERFPATQAGVDGMTRLAADIERATPGFRWQRLFDAEGHSQMPAWVIGSTGTSLVAIGVSLIATRAIPLRTMTIVGQMALTFYAYQAIVINWTPERPTTDIGTEYLLVAGLTAAFAAFAWLWRLRFRRGPLEALLRIGSGR